MSVSSRSPSTDQSIRTQQFSGRVHWALIGIGGLFFLASILVVVGVPTVPPGGLAVDDGNSSQTPETSTSSAPTEMNTEDEPIETDTDGEQKSDTSTTASTPPPTETQATTSTATETQTTTSTSPQTTSPQAVYRINVGGPSVGANGRGPDWSSDSADNPSPYLNARKSNTVAHSTPDEITVENNVPSGVPNAVFKTYRFDQASDEEMVWRFPVDSNREYTVRLYFLEAYFTANESGREYEEPYSEGGPRSFGVAIEDRVVLQNYEPFKEHGHDVGAMKSFEVTADDGVIEIRFLREVENPTVSGIEIVDTGPRKNNTA